MVLQAPGALFLLFREEHKHSVKIKPLHCTVEIERSVPDVRWPLPVMSVLKQRWARLLSLQTTAQGEWPGRSYSTTREKQFQGKSGPTCCSTATTHTLPCKLRWQQTMSLNVLAFTATKRTVILFTPPKCFHFTRTIQSKWTELSPRYQNTKRLLKDFSDILKKVTG